jgi:hypothetical protein
MAFTYQTTISEQTSFSIGCGSLYPSDHAGHERIHDEPLKFEIFAQRKLSDFVNFVTKGHCDFLQFFDLVIVGS